VKRPNDPVRVLVLHGPRPVPGITNADVLCPKTEPPPVSRQAGGHWRYKDESDNFSQRSAHWSGAAMMNRRRRSSGFAPITVSELRRRCQGWPVRTVRQAVLDVIGTEGQSRRQCEALADLIAFWLTEDDNSESPPLNALCVRRIWTILDRSRQ
jgi:hypothetical protein